MSISVLLWQCKSEVREYRRIYSEVKAEL